MTTDSDIEHTEAVWITRICLVLSAIVWAGFVVAFTLALGGCVATESKVDKLSQQVADTAGTLANLADSHERMAQELGSAQAHAAGKIAVIASGQAADAVDLADTPSGFNVDLKDAANKAMTGDWVGLGGLIVSTLLGGYAYQQKRRATVATTAAYEAAELDPPKARELLKARKV